VIVFDELAPLFPRQTVRTLGSAKDAAAQAHRVFDALRSFDATAVKEIYAQCPDAEGLGFAVSNRLKKAAGFHEIDASDGKCVLGITGGTGAGKTSLLGAMEKMGALVLDCDAIYYELLRTDAALRGELNAAFPGVVSEEGVLDRARLGKLVFGDRAALSRLDAIVRAYIPREIARRIAASDKTLVGIDAVKLMESGLAALCDVTVAVTAPEEARIRRIMERDGIREDYARARVRAQRDEQSFRAQCDEVFENGYESFDEAEAAAGAFIKQLLRKLKEDMNHGRKEEK